MINAEHAGPGLLAKVVCQAASSQQTLRVRQQAGSYRRLHSPSAFDRAQVGAFPPGAGPTKTAGAHSAAPKAHSCGTGFSREAFDLL